MYCEGGTWLGLVQDRDQGGLSYYQWLSLEILLGLPKVNSVNGMIHFAFSWVFFYYFCIWKNYHQLHALSSWFPPITKTKTVPSCSSLSCCIPWFKPTEKFSFQVSFANILIVSTDSPYYCTTICSSQFSLMYSLRLRFVTLSAATDHRKCIFVISVLVCSFYNVKRSDPYKSKLKDTSCSTESL
jgi:hypothetical protein